MNEPDGTVENDDEYPASDYAWCLHCERTYKSGEHRKVKTPKMIREIVPDMEFIEMCYYDDCDGDAEMDAWNWGKVAALNGYPEIPEHGKVYPLYPPS